MKKQLKKLSEYFYKRPEVVFACIALPFGIFSAVAIPQLSVTDENAHILRAYQVANGEFVCLKKTFYPQDIVDKSKTAQGGSRMYTRDFSDVVDTSKQVEYPCGSAAGYSPLAYIPQSLGIIAAKVVHPTTATIVLIARIANLLFYVAAIYLIIKKVRIGKYVFFTIALIPQMIHLAASLSADMMNNVIVFAVVALMLNLFTQTYKISKKQIAILFGLVVAMALLKKTTIIVLLPLIFLPTLLFKENLSKKLPFNIQKWTTICLSLGFAAAAYIAWTAVSFVPAVSNGGAPNAIVEHPNLFLNLMFNTYLSDYGDIIFRGVIGDFSSFLYHFPTVLLVVQCILLFMVFMYRPSSEKKVTINNHTALMVGSVAAFTISIIVITYGMYTEWGLKRGITYYADGVQGRYFTALTILLLPLFAWVRKYIAITAKSDRTLFSIVVLTQTSLLCFYVIYTVKLLIET